MPPLTKRELVILQWLTTPLTQRRIARELSLSINTVKSHIAHIYQKLDANSRDEAIERARALRLVNADGARATLDYEALVEHSRALITVVNADRELVWANRAYRDLLGEEPDRHFGHPAWEIVHPEDRERLARLFFEASRTPGASVTFECRLAHADCTWRNVEVHQVNRLHDPAVRGFVGTTRAIDGSDNRHRDATDAVAAR